MNSDSLIVPQCSPTQAIIFLHGYGADGNDLMALHPYFKGPSDDFLFCAPHAPDPCESNAAGRQWFSLSDWPQNGMLDSTEVSLRYLKRAEAGASYLIKYINAIKENYDLQEDQISLIGFSQGSMMALYVALNHFKSLRAVVAFAGALINMPINNHCATRFMLIHGGQDSTISYQVSQQIYQILRTHNYNIGLKIIKDLGHSINQDALHCAQEFLQNNQISETMNY